MHPTLVNPHLVPSSAIAKDGKNPVVGTGLSVAILCPIVSPRFARWPRKHCVI
jgi:hypothetical protein